MHTDKHNRWGPGELEAQTCLSKMRYDSGVEAAQARGKMRKRHHGTHKGKMDIYRCPYCKGYHIGKRGFDKIPRRVRLYLSLSELPA